MTWRHLKDETPRARRRYICGLCGLRIRKGARHVLRHGIDRGEGYTAFRMHAVCESLSRKWDADDWECHDDYEFRRWELQLPLLPRAKGG